MIIFSVKYCYYKESIQNTSIKNPFLVDTVKTKLFRKKIVSIFKYSLIFYKYPNDLTVNNSVIDVI